MTPHPPSPAGGRPDPAATGPATLGLFCAVFGFLLVGLHLVFDPTTYDKTLVPRLLALTAFLAMVLPLLPLLPVGRMLDGRVLRDPVVLCYAAYAALTAVSLVTAVNVSAGLTDVFRTLAALLVLGLAAVLLPTVPRWQERLVMIVVVAAAVSGGVGWATMLARHGLGVHGRTTMEQVRGLMSSVNLYAHFLDMLLPICLAGIAILRGAWRAAAAAVSLGVGTLLVLLQTRSAYVGLAAGLGTGLFLAVGCGPALGIPRRVRRGLVGLFLGGCVGVVGFVAAAPESNPIARRVRSIVVEPTGPDAKPREGGRLVIWELTRRMIADHPWAGVGAGNFPIRLHEYFAADVDLDRLHTLNWRQPHNDPLWVCAEKGIFGLGMFGGIFVSAGLAIRRILRSGPSRTDAWLAVGTAMALVAYTIGSVFDFPLDRVSHQVVLAVLLAAVVAMRRAADGATAAPQTVPWRWLLPPALLALGLTLAYAAAARRQEQQMVRVLLAEEAADWQAVVEHARRAATPWRTLDPLSTPVAFHEGMGHLHLGDRDAAIACLERARTQNPNRMQILNNLGVAYASAGDLARAIECFQAVTDRYPNHVEGFVNLANCLLDCSRPAEAVTLLEGLPARLQTDAVRGTLARARAAARAAP